MQHANSQSAHTQAWSQVKSTDEKVNSHVHAYKRARQAMVTLGADKDIMQWFKDIMPEDIKVSKDIMEEGRWNQRNEVLP